MEQNQIVAKLINQLQQTLVELNMWQQTPPSLEALNSQMPFAYDTMGLEQWLQFVFLPKMQQLIDENKTIPPMAITPYAEQVFTKTSQQTILKILRQLDDVTQ